jgi:two-component system chemotaxis sensor kinase CheA
MLISGDQIAKIEEVANRLSGEALLAVPGGDEGLIPAYSLLGELAELCASIAAVRGPVAAVHAAIDRRLEAAQPFDAETLGELLRLSAWLPGALDRLRAGEPVPAWASAVAPKTPAAAAPPSPAGPAAVCDVLLTLDLDANRELLGDFYGEAVEHLHQIEAALLALELAPEDPEALSAIFRSFHTIKGNAGFLGLAPMHALAHEVETLLDLARNQKIRIDSAIITEILRSRDAIQALNQQVAAALEHGRRPEEIIPVGHLIATVRKLVQGAAIRGPAPAGSILTPPPEPLPPETPESAPPAGREPAAPGADLGESKTHANHTVRVNTEKLDVLMDVVGELVIVQSQLCETARRSGALVPSLAGNVGQLSRITKELQHTAMSLRMIPIRQTFQKMERMARDLAHACGKKAVFSTQGGETELDRTMVEEIADPLVHMVRNALDHGLETPAERVAAGKPELGAVVLRAYHEGSQIVIELQDDGRGLDPEKILAKARRQGLVPGDARPDEEEIFNLIFVPGFSTAEKITGLSGRGVGMDVVKRNVERLRGRIDTISVLGRGTTFKIKLPLTMAIIDGLVVRVGDDRFILPSTSVQRALRPTRENIVTVQGCGEVLDLRGRMIPLHRLHRRFGIPARANEPWEGIVVIVEAGGKICALLVDEMISKQEVVIKNLGAFMQGISSAAGISGGAILGDGNIALILDPAALLHAA